MKINIVVIEVLFLMIAVFLCYVYLKSPEDAIIKSILLILSFILLSFSLVYLKTNYNRFK